MPTRLVDLDLDAPLPAALELEGRDRVRILVWRQGVPVGTALLEPEPGADRIRRAALEAALAPFAHVAPDRPAASPHAAPSVSVVICTRDRPDRLPIALAALRDQTCDRFELVVVDNAPTDDRTRRVVEAEWPDATYVVEPVPGLPRARNAGIRAAGGDVLAFTDDDCRPIPLWVEAIASSFAADPGLGCVTGPILTLELESPAQEAMERRGGFNRGFRRRRHTFDAPDGAAGAVQAWKYGAGGCIAFSRGCLCDLGGFDEALWRSEDLDIFYRTLRAGYALRFEPAAAVRHRHLPTWRQLRRRLFHWGWGYLTYLDKIARSGTAEEARRARAEKRNWLDYQLRARLGSALRGRDELPAALILTELLGGLAGWWAYPLARRVAVREAARAARRAPRRLQPLHG